MSQPINSNLTQDSNPNLSQELDDLFLLNLSTLSYFYDQINDNYRLNPTYFADRFFDLVDQIDPKVVRLIAYQLKSNGTDLGQLYDQRSSNEPASFLSRLSEFPNETILVLLNSGFPPYPQGNHYLWYSLEQYLPEVPYYQQNDYDLPYQPVIKSGNWLDFNLDLIQALSINLDYVNTDGQTLLQKAIQQRLLTVTIKLLMAGAQPDSLSFKLALDLVNPLTDQPGTTSREEGLVLIRQLIRYGAVLDEEDRLKIISMEASIRGSVETTIITGQKLDPIYNIPNSEYYALDTIENLALVGQLNPELVLEELPSKESFEFSPEFTSTLVHSFERVRRETMVISQNDQPVLLTWPKYIDSTSSELSRRICPLEEEAQNEQLSVESPFSPEETMRLALRGLPSIKPLVSSSTISSNTNATPSATRIVTIPSTLTNPVWDEYQPSRESIERWPGPVEAIFNPFTDPNGFVDLITPREIPQSTVQGSLSYLPGTIQGPSEDNVIATVPLVSGPLRPTLHPSLPSLPLP